MDTSSYPQNTVLPGPSELPQQPPSDAGQHQRALPSSSIRPINLLTESDPCWPDDHLMLFKWSRLVECFPTPDQTLEERVNSVSRLSLYLGILLSVFQKRSLPFQISTLILVFVYFAWKSVKTSFGPRMQPGAQVMDTFDNVPTRCTMPSKDNPRANLLPGDPMNRGPACVGPEAEERARSYLNPDLFKDVDELFSKRQSQQFYTLPVTTVVSDRDKYANLMFAQHNDWAEGGTADQDEDRAGMTFNMATKGPPPTPDMDLRRQRSYTPGDIKYEREASQMPEMRI